MFKIWWLIYILSLLSVCAILFNHRYRMPYFAIVLWSIKPKETEEGNIWHSDIGFINWHLGMYSFKILQLNICCAGDRPWLRVMTTFSGDIVFVDIFKST